MFGDDKRKVFFTDCVPVTNRSGHDILLRSRTVLGELYQMRSVLPGSDGCVPADDTPCARKTRVHKVTAHSLSNPSGWTPPVELSHLTVEQRQAAEKMLKEKAGAFVKDDDDMGCIKNLQMNIELHDDKPVQKSYFSVPRRLYIEVKEYLQDLMKRRWITKSSSPYSSPIVCVRKKDGSLRLCINYRELNNKTIPDRQPIPRIQDVLDGLGGNSWFSTLDQGKAYHQGVMSEESRPLTAFVTPWGLYECNKCRIAVARGNTCKYMYCYRLAKPMAIPSRINPTGTATMLARLAIPMDPSYRHIRPLFLRWMRPDQFNYILYIFSRVHFSQRKYLFAYG